MPRRTDIASILVIGAGPIVIGQACEFDYSGTQAVKALKAEGYRVILVNSNPATIMTDPELADATYIEPITPEVVAKIIARGAARCVPADHGRPDRAQHGAHARRGRHLRALRRRADRGLARGDRQGRGPRAVPRRDGADRPRDAEERGRALAGRGRARARRGRPAGDHPAELHARRLGRRRRLQSRGVRSGGRGRPRRLADRRGPGRGVGPRLERVRDGGGARPGRQLHHRLLDRERRPDGGAHRRQHHGRAGADADRQGIPADAQRLDRGPARDRGRHRRLERAVRGQSGRRPDGDHRDEPAGVALLGAGVQGDRLPDRQGRGPARGRLHARRDHQRHHRRDAGLVRADHRLRGHQGAALHLREVPGDRADPDHGDEVGRRGHGARPHLRGVAAEGAALARDRPRRAGRDRDRGARRPGAAAGRAARGPRPADPRPAAGDRPGVPRRPARARRSRAPAVTIPGFWSRSGPSSWPRSGSGPEGLPGDAEGWLELKAMGFSDARLAASRARGGRGRGPPARARRASGVQAGRHLRGRVRGPHALSLQLLRDRARRRRTARRPSARPGRARGAR